MIEPGRPARDWLLDPSVPAELDRLREVLGRRASSATWHSSDEPKALATARHLTDRSLRTWPALREAHRSDWFATQEEFRAAVRDAFAEPARAARPGWEPLAETRTRVSAVVADLVARDGTELVLVGHGTAWTLLVSELTGRPPDLSAWEALCAPDLCTLDLAGGTVSHRWGEW